MKTLRKINPDYYSPRKANWIGHINRRKCPSYDANGGKLKGTTGLGRRGIQLNMI